jgi:chemotaxis protein MotB
MSNQHAHIIKKIKKNKKVHHGGSWKIAYADFVTAMMAFFLLMWLLSILNKYQLEGIATYFKRPLSDLTHPVVPGSNAQIAGKKNQFTAIDHNVLNKNQSELENIRNLKNNLEQQLQNIPQLAEFKNQLSFQMCDDGLKIDLKELKDKPMFDKGRSVFISDAYKVFSWIGQEVNSMPNKVVIVGHTDSSPYNETDNSYNNWDLSADRANAARRALMEGGMDEDKVLRVMGAAATDLLDRQDTQSPANRRIEIILLTKAAADKISSQTGP